MQNFMLISNPLKRFKKVRKSYQPKNFFFFITVSESFRPITFLLLASMALLLIPMYLVLLTFLNPPQKLQAPLLSLASLLLPCPYCCWSPCFWGVPAILAWRPFYCLIIYSVLPCLLLLATPLYWWRLFCSLLGSPLLPMSLLQYSWNSCFCWHHMHSCYSTVVLQTPLVLLVSLLLLAILPLLSHWRWHRQ